MVRMVNYCTKKDQPEELWLQLNHGTTAGH